MVIGLRVCLEFRLVSRDGWVVAEPRTVGRSNPLYEVRWATMCVVETKLVPAPGVNELLRVG